MNKLQAPKGRFILLYITGATFTRLHRDARYDLNVNGALTYKTLPAH